MKKIVVTADIIGIAPISFNRAIQSKKETGENHDTFEERTWRERLHIDSNGEVFIPPMALKNCLRSVAKYLSETVPGKGKATYTKHFVSGTMVVDTLMLGVKGKDVVGEKIHVPSDGRVGGGTKVWKTFPIIPEWRTNCVIHVIDPILIAKPEKIEEYLSYAGEMIGFARFRPQNNGYYGRFKIENFKVSK